MPNIILPYRPTDADPRSIAGILNDFDTCKNLINGGLANDNFVGGASIVDSKLASPNNALRRIVAQHTIAEHISLGGGTRTMVACNNGRGQNPGNDMKLDKGPFLIPLDPADHAVAGKSTTYWLQSHIIGSSSSTAATVSVTSHFAYAGTIGGGPAELRLTPGAEFDSETTLSLLADVYCFLAKVVVSSGTYNGSIQWTFTLWVRNI